MCAWVPYSSAHHDRAPNQKHHLELLQIRICITKVDEYIKTKWTSQAQVLALMRPLCSRYVPMTTSIRCINACGDVRKITLVASGLAHQQHRNWRAADFIQLISSPCTCSSVTHGNKNAQNILIWDQTHITFCSAIQTIGRQKVDMMLTLGFRDHMLACAYVCNIVLWLWKGEFQRPHDGSDAVHRSKSNSRAFG